MSNFRENGYELCSNIIDKKYIYEMRDKMHQIMQPYCEKARNLDECFNEITTRSKVLRSNIYKLFGMHADVPLFLSQPGVRDKLKELGFNNFTIQACSVVCMEPNVEKYLFSPHQDLKARKSMKSAVLWIPLSEGESIGGLKVYPNSHKSGPIKHGLTNTGHLIIEPELTVDYQEKEIVNYKLGDCLIFSPYLIHWSVGNTGHSLRWTAIVKIDEVNETTWLDKSISPFNISSYIDERSNKERLDEAENNKLRK